MIISVNNKFIFVANLKSASTSIEAALRPHGDIIVARTPLGKHLSFSEIQDRFDWVFSCYSLDTFYKFAVIRNPLDYVLSIYRSHAHEKFKENKKLYTGQMSFDVFMSSWVERNKEQVLPQSRRFYDKNGNFALDYLIRYEELESDFNRVTNRIGIPEKNLPLLNISPTIEVNITNKNKRKIMKMFDEDYDVINTFAGI